MLDVIKIYAMTENEFDYLCALTFGRDVSLFSDKIKHICAESFWVKDGAITAAGLGALNAYRVASVIITVSGGKLLIDHGEALVARLIKQAFDAGIANIIIVTDAKSSIQFQRLLHSEFGESETRVSVMELGAFTSMAGAILGSSYVVSGNLRFAHNPFSHYEYESYYLCLYSDEWRDEYFVKSVDSQNYILSMARYGERGWRTTGLVYVSRDLSQAMSHFETERGWELIIAKHIESLSIKKKECTAGELKEF